MMGFHCIFHCMWHLSVTRCFPGPNAPSCRPSRPRMILVATTVVRWTWAGALVALPEPEAAGGACSVMSTGRRY